MPLWRGNQEFTSRGTLSYNWLEKNVLEGRKENNEITKSDPISADWFEFGKLGGRAAYFGRWTEMRKWNEKRILLLCSECDTLKL